MIMPGEGIMCFLRIVYVDLHCFLVLQEYL